MDCVVFDMLCKIFECEYDMFVLVLKEFGCLM